MRNGMNKDFSWNASAREHVKIYDNVGRCAGRPKPRRKRCWFRALV
jgi:hypothetical protein